MGRNPESASYPSAMPKRNSLDPRTHPGAAFGVELRVVRESAGFPTRVALARRTGYSLSVIGRGESGHRPPSPEVLATILDACKVGGERREDLVRQCLRARRILGIPAGFRSWIALEEKSDYIRIWCPQTIPGLLQTVEYIRGLYLLSGADEDEADEKAVAQLERQRILDSDTPVQLAVVIDELALRRQMGSPEIMIRALEHLLVMSRRRTITIQVVRGNGGAAGANRPFQIASGPEIPDTVLVQGLEDRTSDDRELLREAVAIFDYVRGEALSVPESREAFMEAIQWWQSRLSARTGASPATAPTAASNASRPAISLVRS